MHKNCRNTKEIARTSVTPLKDKKQKAIKATVACSWEKPIKPTIHVKGEDTKRILDQILSDLREKGVEDIVILTSGTFEHSSIYSQLRFSVDPRDSYAYYPSNGEEYRFTTCIRFKGLEADAIIMIDLDKDSFTGKKGLEFYVGSSRAKHYLDVICNLSEADYYEVAHTLDPNAPKRDNPVRMKRILGDIFGARIKSE